MIEICIAGDVTDKYILADSEQFVSVACFHFFFNRIEGKHQLKIEEDELKQMKKMAYDSTIKLMANPTLTMISPIVLMVPVEFDGQTVQLNYKNKEHFLVGLLISIYNLCTDIIDLKGKLYLFNRSFLNKKWANSIIISRLKRHEKMSFNELKSECLRSEKESLMPITDEDIRLGIKELLKYDFISEFVNDCYVITRIGLILVL